MKVIFLKFIGILICISSGFVMYIGDFNDFSIAVGTVVLIIGIVFYIMSNPKTYNNSVSSVRQLTNTRRVTMVDFYNTFKSFDSVLGKPWLGKIKMIKGKCLIFGPTQNGDFLYLNKVFGNFYLSSNPISAWITGPKEEMWRLTNPQKIPDIFSEEELICYSLITQSALDDIFHSLDEFAKNGSVIPFPIDKKAGTIYRFNEDFKLTGQRFQLTDFSGTPIYEINSTIPLKTFYMTDLQSKEEVFKITKRIFNLLDHYDFYLNGQEFGSFKQKIDIMHDVFTLETPDGTIEMKNVNDTIGCNYIVKLDNRVIATIAERFNLTAYNLVFDNFIIHLREDKYLPLITALAVMAARELARDRN